MVICESFFDHLRPREFPENEEQAVALTTCDQAASTDLIDIGPEAIDALLREILNAREISKDGSLYTILGLKKAPGRFSPKPSGNSDRANALVKELTPIRTSHLMNTPDLMNPPQDHREFKEKCWRVMINPILAAFRDQKSQVQLQLHPNQEKDGHLDYHGGATYMSAKADYTISFRGTMGRRRDYIVVDLNYGNRFLDRSQTELVTYMGLVHKERKRRGKKDTVVHGIQFDGTTMRFWKIDNNSQISESMPCSMENYDESPSSSRNPGPDETLTYLESIFEEGARTGLSPFGID